MRNGDTVNVAIHILTPDKVGRKIGFVLMYDSPEGLVLEPSIHSLEPGEHGFHIHEFGDIRPKLKDGKSIAGGSAGQHYDPMDTDAHCGPYGNGHLGDLPVLIVDQDGTARTSVVAPRLTLDEVKNRSLIIHSGGDNYSDFPVVNGGGKSRIAGGVITNSCPYCEKNRNLTWGLLALAGAGYFLSRKN